MENVRQENASVVVPNKDMNIGQFPPGKASPRQAHQMKDANKPWSIRNQARREAAQDIEEGKEPEKPKVMTRARRVVMKAFELAEAGDMRAIEFLTENIDGKLPQTNINTDFAQLESMNDADIDAFNRETEERIRQLEGKTTPGGSPTDKAAPVGSAGSDSKAAAVVDALSLIHIS